jgi:hypothetical protein
VVVGARAGEAVRLRTFAAVALLLTVGFAISPVHDAAGAAKNKAGLVVRYGDGHVEEMCVFFDEPSISGLDLLERSGETFVAERSSLGSAICKIDEQGCDYPSEDCFCEYPNFWGYWVRDPGESVWTFSDTGASDHEVKNGSVDGWSWGPNGAPSPPLTAFDQVCPASASGSASPTSKASSTKEPRSTEPSRTAASRNAGSRPGDATSVAGSSETNAPSPSASDALTTVRPSGTSDALAAPRASSSRPNYVGFVLFAALFAAAAAAAVVLRRRRA